MPDRPRHSHDARCDGHCGERTELFPVEGRRHRQPANGDSCLAGRRLTSCSLSPESPRASDEQIAGAIKLLEEGEERRFEFWEVLRALDLSLFP